MPDATALSVGLKVDADVLPPGILKTVDLKSAATTVALLKMNAIVGIQAKVDANNHITRQDPKATETNSSAQRLPPAKSIREVKNVLYDKDGRATSLYPDGYH